LRAIRPRLLAKHAWLFMMGDGVIPVWQLRHSRGLSERRRGTARPTAAHRDTLCG